MSSDEILISRLFNTGLSRPAFSSASAAVSHLGAVQAQDYTSAKWSLGLRITNSSEGDIDKDYDAGKILRIHVMRPTWHFVVPDDIRWLVQLTAPRVIAAMASSNHRIGLDGPVFTKSNDTIVKALQGQKFLTRHDLKTALTGAGIVTDVQRLAHIIARAELDGLICSGPRRGKQFTYALMDERVPNTPRIERGEALMKLARKYFTSHGPAQLVDFSWWAGIPLKEAVGILNSIKSELEQTTLNHKSYWFPPASKNMPDPPPALLLSVYDEYTIAYRDRGGISEGPDFERLISTGAAVSAAIVLNGKIAGTWRKTSRQDSIDIRINPFRKLTAYEKRAIDAEITRFGVFFGKKASLVDE